MTGLMQENLTPQRPVRVLHQTSFGSGSDYDQSWPSQSSSVNWLPLKILYSALSATVLCRIGLFF